jgi:hypothetical protein
MEVIFSSEALLELYRITLRNIQKDRISLLHGLENLRSTQNYSSNVSADFSARAL